MRSSATGQVVKRLASFGLNFTNNGLALSPDGQYVYFTLIPGGRAAGLLIERIAVASGARRLIVRGDQPSLSPNGRLLVYLSMSGPSRVFVKNLRSGLVRSISLAGIIGPNQAPTETPAAWVRGSTALALGVTGRPVLVGVDRTETRGSQTKASQALRPPAKLVVVKVAPRTEPLQAHELLVHGLRGSGLGLGSDGSAPDSVLMSQFDGDTQLVYSVSLASTSYTAHQLAHIRAGLILAFASGGRRLLYLQDHRPPALWTGTIRDGRIVRARRLLKDSRVSAVAW